MSCQYPFASLPAQLLIADLTLLYETGSVSSGLGGSLWQYSRHQSFFGRINEQFGKWITFLRPQIHELQAVKMVGFFMA